MNIESALIPESRKSEDKVIDLKNKAKLSTVLAARVSANSDSNKTCSSVSSANTAAADKIGHDFVGIAG